VAAAFALAAVAVALGGIAAITVLDACGVRLFGADYRFAWCRPRITAMTMFQREQDRMERLQNRIHQAELALLDPELCGPAAQEDANLCAPGQRPASPPQEVALIVDGSSSMSLSVNVDPVMEREFLETIHALEAAHARNSLQVPTLLRKLDALDRQLSNVPGPSRSDVAGRVLRDAIGDIPDSLALNMTTFRDCGDIRSRRYAPGDRAGAIGQIAGLEPDGGTPLAQSMRRAARTLRQPADPDTPIYMVLITDGMDSCNGDPCTTARRLKRQMPNLVINVVDLSQADALQCVTEATGGTYSRTLGANALELDRLVRDAAQIDAPQGCVPR